MRTFKIIPISKEEAATVRELKIDKFGNEVIEQIASGYGPCRVSLRPFAVGKDVRLLFSHSPFNIKNVFNQLGPIFIHKNDVELYTDVYRFPPEIKADKINFPLSLIGYSMAQQMVFTRLVGDDDVDALIPQIFDKHPEVDYLHARNAEACCFICKIERV